MTNLKRYLVKIILRNQVMTKNAEKNNGPGADLEYSKELYKDSSKTLSKAYIIMIAFVIVFFFGAFIPYIDLQHKLETSVSDKLLQELNELSILTLQQENLSKTIQNHFDAPTIAAINDYQWLNGYFRKLELIRSESMASSNNISVNQLETVVPTFLVCNQVFHKNVTYWVMCNAKYVAEGINKKIVSRYQPIAREIVPLVTQTKENLDAFQIIAAPLISKNNKEIISKLPPGIDPESWKQSISNSLGVMITSQSNSYKVLNFTSINTAQFLAWELLSNPSALRLTYNSQYQKDFNNVINLLNNSKNQIKDAIKALTAKFEEVEFPVVGKIPVGLENAVVFYPAAVGVGALLCSYYLAQTISKRLIFQKKLNDGTNFDRGLYPLWVDPLDPKKKFRYGRLILFISLPLVVLLAIAYFLYISPIKEESAFGIEADFILAISLSIGLILTAIGLGIILKEEHEYRFSVNKNKKR